MKILERQNGVGFTDISEWMDSVNHALSKQQMIVYDGTALGAVGSLAELREVMELINEAVVISHHQRNGFTLDQYADTVRGILKQNRAIVYDGNNLGFVSSMHNVSRAYEAWDAKKAEEQRRVTKQELKIAGKKRNAERSNVIFKVVIGGIILILAKKMFFDK